MKKYFILILFAVLCSVTLAQGQVVTHWQGTTSFQVKITFVQEDAFGNVKFDKIRDSFNGTIDLTTSGRDLVPDINDCLIAFTGNDGTKLCITDAAFPTTNSNRTRSDDLLLIGIGEFSTTLQGNLFTGIGYLNADGDIRQNIRENDATIILKGTLSGGSGNDLTFTGDFKAVLNPVQ